MTIRKNSRHIRWNWHESRDANADDNQYLRYHFVVVHDKNRDSLMMKILEGLARYGSVIPVRKVEGKVSCTRYRYLFCSYDSPIKPDMINWNKVGLPLRRDSDLKERKRGNIEDYVAGIYE